MCVSDDVHIRFVARMFSVVLLLGNHVCCCVDDLMCLPHMSILIESFLFCICVARVCCSQLYVVVSGLAITCLRVI